ncbi:lipopolysaccharide heptosyltransferase I [Helicobacter brantae]|uniref:Lipopolysaccharide heptosyltransferase 1 n=1 Tax=Helicobacter brantae TaxID=375927 RepID=A0A3D8IVS6_9HELI|nr:lipopolysaccharide heptosyltransferase I [Helicobacter brantae]RDU69379.1 lipopolysaccharide heptosyltransferase I [Helicobacter brantae]
MRIAIVRLSALGDVIVALSSLPTLKAQYPQSQIDWFVDERFAPILQNSPYIDNLYSIPLKRAFSKFDFKAIKGIFSTLSQTPRYDKVIDMQGLLKSAILGKFLKSNAFVGFDWHSIKEPMASLFYTQKISIPYERNILERNEAVLQISSTIAHAQAFGFTPQAHKKIQSLLSISTQTKVLLVLEASKREKMYPLEQYASLMELLKNQNFTFFLLSHAYRDEAEKLGGSGVLLPPLSLDEVKALVSSVDIVVGGDTGITHLAWAMQKPSITLYGNTPMQRFILKGEKNFSLSGNNEANYQKNDFSIAKISPKEIADLLIRIRE